MDRCVDEPDLPSDWEIAPLGDLCQPRKAIVDPQDSDRLPYVGLEHLDSGALRISRWGDSGDVKSSKTEFREGDVLYGKLRPYLDKAALAAWRGLCTTELLAIEADRTRLDPFFLLALVHSKPFIQHAVDTTGGTNLPRTSWNALKEFIAPVPPLPEQQAIAQVLRTVQRAKEATEKVLAATKQLKQSLLRHLFTYGPVPFDQADQVELKGTEIGPMPEHWGVVPIGELIVDGPQNGMYRPQSEYGSGTPIVRIDDYANEGGIVCSAANRVRLTPTEVETYKLTPGDILVNRVNSLSHLGKVAIVGQLTEPMVFESNMMRFSVASHSLPGFVFRFLTTPTCREQFRTRAKRAVAQSSINQGDVKTTLMSLPDLAEQEMIVRSIAALDAKAEAEGRRLKSLDTLFDTLLHHLMTGKVRVHDLGLALDAQEGLP